MSPETTWRESQSRLLSPRPGVLSEPMRPADIAAALEAAMLAAGSLLEDAQYQKVAPNLYRVEVAADDYTAHYQPLEADLCRQWQAGMLNALTTANSRLGRREYRFAGGVEVTIEPADDLAAGQARLRRRSRADEPAVQTRGEQTPAELPACLELVPDGREFKLRTGWMTIGRDDGCDIVLDAPRVQELRLVSGQHAYLVCTPGTYRLFDGTTDGRPSLNGTFINRQPVPRGGQLLQDGDIIILAALRRHAPVLDTPGVVGLRFRAGCQ